MFKCLYFRHSFHPTVSVRLSWFKCWCSNVLEISSASKVFYLSVFLNDASTLQADVFWWWLTFKGLVTVMVSIVTCGAPMLTPAGWAWPAHSNYQPSYRSPHTGRALDRWLWKIFHSYNQKYFREKYLFLSFVELSLTVSWGFLKWKFRIWSCLHTLMNKLHMFEKFLRHDDMKPEKYFETDTKIQD